MSKRLKSFHKLFFIVIFSILFSGVIGSSNSPELPEKIAPELEQIEALPRRTKPAELNIEITKIKSEPLEEVYIDRKNKNIYVDFSKKREQALKGVRNAEDLEKKYNLIISEKVQSSGEVVGKGRTKMATNPQVMTYETAELDGKKMLKIPYENEPEKLYISVQENNQVIKVYSMDISRSTEVSIPTSAGRFAYTYTPLLSTIPTNINGSLELDLGIIEIIQKGQGKPPLSSTPPSVKIFPVIALTNNIIYKNNYDTNGFKNNICNYPYSLTPIYIEFGNGKNNSYIYLEELEPFTPISQSAIARTTHNFKGFADGKLILLGTFSPTYETKQPLDKIKAKIKVHISNADIQYLKGLNPSGGEIDILRDLYVHSGTEYPTSQFTGYPSTGDWYPYDNTNTPISFSSRINIESSSIPIKNRAVTITYTNGFDVNKVNFDNQGNPSRNDIQVEKETEFSSGLGSQSATHITIQELDSNDNVVKSVSGGRDTGATNEISLEMTDSIISFDKDGNLNLQMKSSAINKNSYKYKLLHRNKNSLDGTILMEDTLIVKSSPEPGMVRTNNLNEFIIEDDIVSEKYKVVSDDLGTLTMQQTKEITSGNLFPFIALGTQTNWKFIDSSSPTKDNLSDISVNYKNSLDTIYELNLNMFLEKKDASSSGTSIEVKNNNKYSGLGIFNNSADNKLEYIANSLKANLISSDTTLNTILTNFRNRSEREIVLTPQGDISNQISYVIGDYTGSLYNVPTTVSLSSVDKKIENIKYPNVKIVKPLFEENITLTIPATYDITTPILFNGSGVNNGLTITSDKNRYLKSLHYASSFNINDASKKNISVSGDSDPYDVTLDNGNGIMALKVQYKGRYPIFQILGLSKSGEYTMVIKHFDPSGLERLKYIVKINASLNESSGKEFEITSSIRDIIIFENGDIEMPNSWIKITQLVENEDRFPIIAINSSTKWKMDTNRPLNPTGNRPKAILKLGDKSLEVPVNIRETPYQNTDKFFIYDRGDMTNRNIATGAYSVSSNSNAGKNNVVEVDFQMFLEKNHIDEIIAYGKTLSGDNNVIPYNDTQEDPHIYGIKGILNKDSAPTFKVDDTNILTEDNSIGNSIIEFPRIIFSKKPSISQHTAVLNFINPVPKSAGDISGTFDLIYGAVSPNNLQGYSHPASLNVSGTTSSWDGFTIIPEYHKVKIYVGNSTTAIKEFTTTESGEMKGTQAIIGSNSNEYIIMKGVNSPIAIGIKKWNFNGENETITLEHISNNRVVAKDIYSISFEQFSPIKYLDSTNSTFIQKVGTNKDITVTANARQDFIDLGNLKLQNYQKDITKTDTDSIGVQIGVDTTELSLNSIPAGAILKGKLVFDDGKTSLTNPNEIGNLKFIITSPATDYDNIVGKTFVLDRTSANPPNPLVFIKGGGQQNSILNKLTITLQDNQAGELPEMSFVSTLNSKTISESDIVNGTTAFNLPGSVTLKQLTGGQGNSVPVIAIGHDDQWNLSPGDRRYPRTTRNPIIAKYQIGDQTIDVEPELLNPIFSIDGGKNIYGQTVSPQKYEEFTTTGKSVTALTYVTNRDTRTERVSAGVRLNIKSGDLQKILAELKKIPGDRVELKPLSNDKMNSTNQAKIAYIHGRDEGFVGDSSEGSKLHIPTNTTLTTKYAYELLPSIFIEKEKFYKNIEINFLPAYKLNDEIKFTAAAITLPDGGVEVRPNNDFKILEGLNYKHKIRMTLPDGTTETYETTDSGSLATPIVKTIEKNGKTITLFINYTSWNETIIKLTNRIGSQYFDIKLEHIDIVSEDIRKTTNLRINSGVSEFNTKNGEMDFVISSRYNATETPGQLISNPLAITSTGITYQTEVLDLKLLNGDFPDAPGDKSVEVNGVPITSSEGHEITLDKGTKLKVTKKDGNLIIKPLKWRYNAKDRFTLTYKVGDTITDRYTFNVICPEFFVASVGVLDFGKLYKIGDPTKTVTTDIKLEYIDGTVNAEYSLDVSQANPDGKLTNSLYLNDEKTLLVKDLKITPEKTENIQNPILQLTGTIDGPSVMETNPGVYQKTIQILIHLQ